jgi:hypothetical protein
MAWIAIPNSGGWEYDDTATIADTYPDTFGTISAGIRSYNTVSGTTRETYIKCRKQVTGDTTFYMYGELDKTFYDNYTPRGGAIG